MEDSFGAMSIAVVFLLATAGFALHLWRRAPREAHTELVKTRDRLGIPAGDYPQAAFARFLARRRGQVAGLALGSVPFYAAVLVEIFTGQNIKTWWVMCVPIGMSVGAAVGALFAPPVRPSGVVTVSTEPRTAAGYLPAPERLLAALAPVLAALGAALAGWVLLHTSTERRDATIAVVAGLVALAGWWFVGRLLTALLDQPTSGTDRVELAWHEALRALSVRDLVSTQVLVCAVAAALPMLVGGSFDSGSGIDLAIACLAVAAGLSVVALLFVQMVDAQLDWFRGHAGKAVLP